MWSVGEDFGMSGCFGGSSEEVAVTVASAGFRHSGGCTRQERSVGCGLKAGCGSRSWLGWCSERRDCPDCLRGSSMRDLMQPLPFDDCFLVPTWVF